MTRFLSIRAVLPAAAILAIALAGSSHATPSGATHDDSLVLLVSVSDWAKAAVEGDADRMASYMADEYLELAWEPAAQDAPAHWRTVKKTEWVESVRSHRDVYTSVDLRNVTVHVQGNIAVVTGEYSQKGASNGKDISGAGIYANTWTKRHDRWMLVHSIFP